MEREFRPDGEQFAEGSTQAQSGVSPFAAFVERLAGETPDSEARGVQVADPTIPFFFMDRINKRFEGLGNDVDDELDGLTFKPTEEQNQLIKHVKLAYGIIAHPFCETKTSSGEPSPVYQIAIEEEIAADREYEGHNSVVLTDQERALLIKIANATGIPIDPERSEYFYDEIQPTH